MPIVFSDHAIRQLRERKLSKRTVARTVTHPEKLIQQSPTRYRAVRTLTSRDRRFLLVVIYDRENSAREVVTAFLTTKFHKYL